MFNFNYLLSSFPSPSSFPAENFNREGPLSHTSSANRGHYDQGDLDAKKKKKKKKKKKGSHTKIWTARGVRDRRVRLSMEVSRKFFGLQDALGFDTASDTLEWLISESGNAIEEVKLANEVPGGGPHTSPADSPVDRDPSRCNWTEKKERRECRARARARARERTQVKRNHHKDGSNSQYRSDFLPRKSLAITTSDPSNKFVSLGLRSLEYAMEPPANGSRDQVAFSPFYLN